MLANDYALTHKSVFKNSGESPPHTIPKDSSVISQTGSGSTQASGHSRMIIYRS